MKNANIRALRLITLSVWLSVAPPVNANESIAEFDPFQPTQVEMRFSTLAPQVCALEISSMDEQNELGIYGMVVAAIPYKQVDQPAFSSGGFYAFRSPSGDLTQINGPLHFSRWKNGPVFPSKILFNYMTEDEHRGSQGSTNKDLESYDSVINSILDLGVRSWQIAIIKQTRDGKSIYNSSYRVMIGSKQGFKEVDLFINPVEFMKFLECSYPLVREFRSALKDPDRDPDLELICDEKIVDPILNIEIPPSTVHVFSDERLAVIKMGDQSKVYDLVAFDPEWHGGGRINGGIINIIAPIGSPAALTSLMDEQFGGYDSFSRFNAITFTQTGDKEYPWRKNEIWRDLDYKPEVNRRLCRANTNFGLLK